MKEKSCGCVVIEDGKVLLIRQTMGHWGFPKGHMEERETEEETAIREVKEETNIDVEIDNKKRYTMEYLTEKGVIKQVVFFIAKRVKGEIKPQESEVAEIMWTDFDTAFETITYNNTKDLLRKIIKDNNLK